MELNVPRTETAELNKALAPETTESGKDSLALSGKAADASGKTPNVYADLRAAVKSGLQAETPAATVRVTGAHAPVDQVQPVSTVATQAATAARSANPQGADSGGTGARGGSNFSTDVRVEAQPAKDAGGGVFDKLVQSRREAGLGQKAMIERITKFTRTSGNKTVGHIRMSMTPENLGKVRMDLKVDDGTLNVACRVDSPEAKAALMSGIEDLREALAEDGMKLGQFDVSVDGGDDNSGGKEERTTPRFSRPMEEQGSFNETRESLSFGTSARLLVDVTA